MPFSGLLGVLFRITQVKSRPSIQPSKGRYYLTMATIRIIIIGQSQSHPQMPLTVHSGFLPLGSQRISFLKELQKAGEMASCPVPAGSPCSPSGGLSAVREVGSA